MQLVAFLGTLAFVLVGSAVGARTLLLARRTGARPEFLLGGSLFAYAAVGQPMVVASRALGGALGHEFRVAAVALGLAGITLCLVGLCLFNRDVYRPDSALATLAVWVVAVVEVGACLLVLTHLSPVPDRPTPETRIGVGLMSVNFGSVMLWTAWESLRYRGLMRKRMAFGLASPMVTNRFLLWGMGAACVSAVSFATMACAAAGLDTVSHPVPLLLTAVSGIVIAGLWTLAFFPPMGYRRWVTGEPAGAAQEA